MVGDSVRHDVRGAVAAGLDVVLLCSGVHHEALGIPQAPAAPERPTAEALRGFLGALPPEERHAEVARNGTSRRVVDKGTHTEYIIM